MSVQLRKHDVQETEGQVMVRRFTDELEGKTPLEVGTKEAQRKYDEDIEEEHRMRLRRFYDKSGGSSRTFDGADAARSALDKSCTEFLAQMDKPAKKSFLGKQSAKSKANDLLRHSCLYTFSDVTSLVDGLEGEWKSSHGKIYKNFQSVCSTLDSHRSIFALFPSQNMYVSVFCGSVSLLLHAAVNHNKVAETLSRTVADISRQAADCANLLHVINTESMCRRLADIYTHVFTFFRDAMKWYLSSKASKVFSSINDSISDQFEEAAQAIKSRINEMYRESQVGGLAEVREVRLTASSIHGDVKEIKEELIADVKDIRDEIFRQRQDYHSQHSPYQNLDFGEMMRQTLLANFQEVKLELDGSIVLRKSIHRKTSSSTIPLEIDEPGNGSPSPVPRKSMKRPDALKYATHLQTYITGASLPSNLSYPALVEPAVLHALQSWISETEDSCTLWIVGPHENSAESSARTAALGVIASAFQQNVPFISHFCERPRYGRGAGSGSGGGGRAQSSEETGLIGCVYSLISQLLQFSIEETDLDLSPERLAKLDGSMESWDTSLDLLEDLLECTPLLPYCVIHGLNDLDWAAGAEACAEVLDVLLRHQERADSVFNILLTTAGRSKTLARCIPAGQRLYASDEIRRVERRGKRLDLVAPEALTSPHVSPRILPER